MLIYTDDQGRELGDKEAAAAAGGVTGKDPGRIFLQYVRKRVPVNNPPPLPVLIDPDTKRKMWDLAECRAWRSRRTGSNKGWPRLPIRGRAG